MVVVLLSRGHCHVWRLLCSIARLIIKQFLAIYYFCFEIFDLGKIKTKKITLTNETRHVMIAITATWELL